MNPARGMWDDSQFTMNIDSVRAALLVIVELD